MLSTDRWPSPACTDLSRNLFSNLRNTASLLVLVVRVREHELLALLRLHEIPGPLRAESEIVRLARAPAQLLEPLPEHQSIASIASASSSERNGRPRTRLNPTASTRNSARTSLSSCPRFISGTSTLS